MNAPTPRSAVSRALWTQGVVAFAMLLALILKMGLGVERVSMLYFAAVLICSAWLGVWYGLLASIAATLAFDIANAGPSLSFQIGTKQDLTNLVVFVIGAWVTGLYVDERRREREALQNVAMAARVGSAAEPSIAAKLVRLLQSHPLYEAARIVGAVSLTMASVGIGSLGLQAAGPAVVSMIYLAGVVLAASVLGPRYALLTALGNVVAYDYFVAEPHFTLALDTATAGVNLVVFLAVGWQVGRFVERSRYERSAVRRIFEGGRSFSATADEGALRGLIAEAVAGAAGASYVVVRDELGRVTAEFGSAPVDQQGPASLPPISGRASPWRIRAMGSEVQPLGSVCWLRPTQEFGRPLDATAEALIDLGAAAVARARISIEYAQLEADARAEQLRRALLASVSHDLRSPLSGILGSATTLLDHSEKFSEAVRRDLLMNIREQGHRLSRYVENLLGMTRLESGTLEPRLEPLLVEPLVLESWEGLVEQAQHTRLEMRLQEGATVIADPTLLKQVFTNLLENAAKYTLPGSAVEVTAATDQGGEVGLIVRDHGPGAEIADLDQLFHPFVRGPNSKAGGVGLGLYIARSFLRAMGGNVEAKACDDGGPGLAFHLRLPAAEMVS